MAGEQMHGFAGDWRVIDNAGIMQTVTDPDFRASHEPIGGSKWRRVGRDRAWRVSEAVVVRTKEGKAAARPGDWVVEARTGARWPVRSEQFDRSYRPIPGRRSLFGQSHRRHARHENYRRFLIPVLANGNGFPRRMDFLRDPASTSDHWQ